MKTTHEDDQGVIPAAINMVDVLKGMMRRKLLILAMTLCASAGAVALVNYLKPSYTTEAQVLVLNLETPFDKVQNTQTADSKFTVDDREVETQIAVLKSGDLGRRVIAALKLQDSPYFNTLLRGMGQLSQIKVMLGFGDDPRLKTPEERALTTYSSNLTVYQVPTSNVIAIKFSSGDPELAAKVANTLADTYVNFTRESGTQPTERAQQWLAQQIDGLRNKVAASDAAVEEFRAKAGLFQGQNSTLGTQELSELNSQITLAEAAKSDAQSRADSIKQLLAKNGTVDASADVLASGVIQTLKQQQTEAMKTVAELSAVYLSNHPKMIAAQKQLENINRRIRSEALKIVAGLEEQARIAAAREASLRGSLDKLKSKATESSLDDVKLKALEREAQANRALLETMLARYAEATARLDPSAQPGFARVIQQASIPTSVSFPKKGPMVLLISLAGLCFGLGLAFLLEIMTAAANLNRRILRAESGNLDEEVVVRDPEIAAQPQVAEPWQPPPIPLPPLTVLPAMLNPSMAVPDEPIGVIAAWFDGERRAQPISSLAITSMGGGPGDASAAAIAFGRAAAERGRRAILVDACSANSWFLAICGVTAGPGLADLVVGTADFTKVIVRDPRSKAHVLRFGLDHSGNARGLAVERMKPVLAALSQSYDVVVVHCGEAAPETPTLIRACGASVLMAPATRLSDVTAAVAVLKNTGYSMARHVLIGQPQATASAVDNGPYAASA